MAEYWPMVLSIRMPEMPTTNLYMKYGMRKIKKTKKQNDKKTTSSNYKKAKKTNMQMK